MESPRFKMGTQYSQVRTVKDVAFLGGRSEYVISGSDDGMAYIYRKSDGALLTRLHGDSNVVNTFASHPSACCLATAGIDSTIKVRAHASVGRQRGESSREDGADELSTRMPIRCGRQPRRRRTPSRVQSRRARTTARHWKPPAF